MDIQLDAAFDREIWQYAKMHDYTIVSKDEVFLIGKFFSRKYASFLI